MGAWVEDNQNAPKPPNYFLQRLTDYDSLLVLLPSRDTPGAYVLARKKQFGPGLTPKALDGVYTKDDTKMCILNNSVPVCMMFHQGNGWDPEPIVAKLMARDTWALGGPDKVADMLEEQEAAAKKKIRDDIRDDMWNRSGDAWRSYQARTGQSSIKFHDNYPAKKPVEPESPAIEEVAASDNTAGARSTEGLGDSSVSSVSDTSNEVSSIGDTQPRLSAGAEPKG